MNHWKRGAAILMAGALAITGVPGVINLAPEMILAEETIPEEPTPGEGEEPSSEEAALTEGQISVREKDGKPGAPAADAVTGSVVYGSVIEIHAWPKALPDTYTKIALFDKENNVLAEKDVTGVTQTAEIVFEYDTAGKEVKATEDLVVAYVDTDMNKKEVPSNTVFTGNGKNLTATVTLEKLALTVDAASIEKEYDGEALDLEDMKDAVYAKAPEEDMKNLDCSIKTFEAAPVNESGEPRLGGSEVDAGLFAVTITSEIKNKYSNIDLGDYYELGEVVSAPLPAEIKKAELSEGTIQMDEKEAVMEIGDLTAPTKVELVQKDEKAALTFDGTNGFYAGGGLAFHYVEAGKTVTEEAETDVTKLALGKYDVYATIPETLNYKEAASVKAGTLTVKENDDVVSDPVKSRDELEKCDVTTVTYTKKGEAKPYKTVETRDNYDADKTKTLVTTTDLDKKTKKTVLTTDAFSETVLSDLEGNVKYSETETTSENDFGPRCVTEKSYADGSSELQVTQNVKDAKEGEVALYQMDYKKAADGSGSGSQIGRTADQKLSYFHLLSKAKEDKNVTGIGYEVGATGAVLESVMTDAAEFTVPEKVSFEGVDYDVIDLKSEGVLVSGGVPEEQLKLFASGDMPALELNTTLKSLTISAKSLTLTKNTFNFLPGLTNLVITTPVDTLVTGSFDSLTNLTSLTLTGNTLELIQKQVFKNNGALDEITLNVKSLKKVQAKAFKGIGKKATITVVGETKKQTKQAVKKIKKGGAPKKVKYVKEVLLQE